MIRTHEAESAELCETERRLLDIYGLMREAFGEQDSSYTLPCSRQAIDANVRTVSGKLTNELRRQWSNLTQSTSPELIDQALHRLTRSDVEL